MPVLGLALNAALNVLFWLVLIQAILSWIPSLVSGSAWLLAFDRAASRITEPLMDPIRRRLPGGASVDFSPLVLLLLIQVVRYVLFRLTV